jgi:hypothetical protein
MRVVVSAVVVAALACGCTTRTGGKVGTAIGGGILTLGVLTQAGALGPGGETDPADVAWIPISIGLVILVPSLIVVLNARQ